MRSDPQAPNRHLRWWLGAVLLLAACGGSSDVAADAGDGTSTTTIESAAAGAPAEVDDDEELAGAGAPAEVDDDEEFAEQIERLTDQAGVDANETDLSTDELLCIEASGVDLFAPNAAPSPDETQAVFQAFLDCLPDIAENDLIVAGYVGGLELGTGNGLEVSLDEGRCMVRFVVAGSEVPARALTQPTADDALVLVDAAEECLSPDQFALFSGQAGFQDYGDDPALDALFDDCEAGDDRSCDLLFLVSAEGSAYRDLAFACAGRAPASETSCSPEAETTTTGFLDPGGPGAGVLVADCQAGDLLACDLLFQLAPIGSDIEDVGSTCGGQLSFAAVPNCRTILGS